MQEAPRISTAGRLFFDRSAGWLRQAEAAGLIPPVPRSSSGQRIFPPEYVNAARAILAARGLRLPEIAG